MAILKKLFGNNTTEQDVIVEPTATVETKVTPAGDIAWETVITGETEAVIYATEK